jgi:hypothetical protein
VLFDSESDEESSCDGVMTVCEGTVVVAFNGTELSGGGFEYESGETVSFARERVVRGRVTVGSLRLEGSLTVQVAGGKP